jgi:hypothetical protein
MIMRCVPASAGEVVRYTLISVWGMFYAKAVPDLTPSPEGGFGGGHEYRHR